MLKEYLSPELSSLWPKTLREATKFLKEAGMEDAQEVYTCLKQDHWCNMSSPTEICSGCGSKASDGMKWLWVG
jgi:hypothetical protein